jgi:hypothetical protein
MPEREPCQLARCARRNGVGGTLLFLEEQRGHLHHIGLAGHAAAGCARRNGVGGTLLFLEEQRGHLHHIGLAG